MSKVTVVSPTWLRVNYLVRCLTALGRQTRLPEEVIVVGRREDLPAQQVVADFAKRCHLSVRWVEVDKPGHIAPIKSGCAQSVRNRLGVWWRRHVCYRMGDAVHLVLWMESLLLNSFPARGVLHHEA
jgi:GT2 family glycosyltransferase